MRIEAVNSATTNTLMARRIRVRCASEAKSGQISLSRKADRRSRRTALESEGDMIYADIVLTLILMLVADIYYKIR